MGVVQRLKKPRGSSAASGPSSSRDSSARSPSASGAGPGWLSAPASAPFALGGVQRKVAVGASNDAFEREADSIANHVASGARVSPAAISSISAPSPNPSSQRQPKPEDNKKEEKPAAQRAARPEDKEKDPKSAGAQLQRQAKPEEKKKDEKPPAPAAQRRTKPEEKKKDEKPPAAAAQRQAKPEEKKKYEKPPAAAAQRQAKPEEKTKDKKPPAPAVQRQTKPEEKTKDEKPPAPAAQRQAKPEEKKKYEKRPAPAAQRQAKPEERKKDERPPAPAAQRQAKPEEKKKDEKPAASPVQREAKPEEKKKDEKPPSPAAQRQAKPEEKKKDQKPPAPAAQRAIRPEDRKKEEVPGTLPVQRAATEEPPEHDHAPVQANRGGAASGSQPSMESAAEHAVATKGPGEPINPATRNTLESGLGTDLSDVRVHSDSAAHSAADALNARAFTHQNDIWLGRGESQHNVPLMAHEATHVVQQTGSVHRMLVQRADKTPDAASTVTAPAPQVPLSSPAGEIYLNAEKMLLPELEIPAFKEQFTPGGFLTIQKGGEERPTGAESQREKWKNTVGKAAESKAEEKLKEKPGIRQAKPGSEVADITDEPSKDPNKILFLYISGSKGSYLIGTPAELKSEFTIPRWGPSGAAMSLDVDHKLELQLGGKNTIDNMWLLNSSANRSSGSTISREINKTISKAVAPHVGKPPWPKAPDPKQVRREFEVTYKTVKGSAALDPKQGKDQKWDEPEVESVDKPLSKLETLSAAEVVKRGLLGKKNSLALYPLGTGGRKKEINWDVKKPSRTLSDKEWIELGFKGLHKASINYDVGKGGAINGVVFRREKGKKILKELPVTFPLKEVGGLPFTVTTDKTGVLQAMRYAELNELSPVQFTEVTMDESRGIVARGKVAPSIPIFKKLDIDIVVEGDDVYLSKTFKKDDFAFPGPIKVTEASLTVAIGTPGLTVEGEVDLEVEGLGKGKVAGRVGSQGGVELSGDFDFDSKLFTPATIHVGYASGIFSGSGKIGIPKGRVTGIESASITASFEGESFKAEGSVMPSIPGIERAGLQMSYDPKAGLMIGGDLQLKKDIPGLSGGSVHAEVTKKPGSDHYAVKASGQATPNIPGISSKLTVSYDDGTFDASATVGYEKGMLKGSITAGATNRPVGDDGQPKGEAGAKAEKITIYGGGSVTLKIAPWLQATAQIMLKPNGEVEVTGEIGLPSTIDIFPEKKLDKNIFKIGLDIPIVGVAVAGQRIGIFANITGGLDLSAGIGPGQLQELKLGVTYNPAHEEDTHVYGGAKLHIPAHAGLRLFVRGSLGVGIPIVSASAGLEIGGQLGLEGALDAGVQVDWTPKKGLVLDAFAEISAEPKFKFDITGFVLVEADLWITTVELYSKRWQLASVEYGSGLKFGLKLPIHYEEGKPFNLSLSDVQFIYPDIDAGSLLKGLISKIA